MENDTVAPAKNSNKKIIIVIGAVVVLLLLGYMMGLFNTGPGGITSPAYFVPGADVNQNYDGSVTYETEEGSVTVGGSQMPASWPSDAPTAYTGAQIYYSGDVNPTTGTSGSSVSYSVTASVESVVEYYESRLKAEGWTIEGTADVSGFRVITAKKDNRTFGVYVMASEGSTQVTAGVQTN